VPTASIVEARPKGKTVELSSGENKIEASCMDSGGVESYRAVTYQRCDLPIKGDLYFIGFGVSRYKSIPSLRYADKDAKDLEAMCRKMSGQYGAVRGGAREGLRQRGGHGREHQGLEGAAE